MDMSVDDVKDYLMDMGLEDTIVYDDYPDAFLGVSNDDRAIYSYSKMIKCLMERDRMTDQEAMEFLDFNTLCIKGDRFPIVLMEKEGWL